MSSACLSETLRGAAILIVEDEYFVAAELANVFEDLGAVVIGPARSVKDAFALLQTEAYFECAVLDINLGNERVYSLAEELEHRGVPFVFTTGYDSMAVPKRFAHVPRCEKPVDISKLLRMLGEQTARGKASRQSR
jgi:CheY-like chemotaxis protein